MRGPLGATLTTMLARVLLLLIAAGYGLLGLAYLLTDSREHPEESMQGAFASFPLSLRSYSPERDSAPSLEEPRCAGPG